MLVIGFGHSQLDFLCQLEQAAAAIERYQTPPQARIDRGQQAPSAEVVQGRSGSLGAATGTSCRRTFRNGRLVRGRRQAEFPNLAENP